MRRVLFALGWQAELSPADPCMSSVSSRLICLWRSTLLTLSDWCLGHRVCARPPPTISSGLFILTSSVFVPENWPSRRIVVRCERGGSRPFDGDVKRKGSTSPFLVSKYGNLRFMMLLYCFLGHKMPATPGVKYRPGIGETCRREHLNQ